MKLTKKQLRRLILKEAMYVSPGIDLQPDIRKDLDPDEIKAADELYKSDMEIGASLGGMPEDHIGMEAPLGLFGTPDMPISKEVLMNTARQYIKTNVHQLPEDIITNLALDIMSQHYPGVRERILSGKQRPKDVNLYLSLRKIAKRTYFEVEHLHPY